MERQKCKDLKDRDLRWTIFDGRGEGHNCENLKSEMGKEMENWPPRCRDTEERETKTEESETRDLVSYARYDGRSAQTWGHFLMRT